jgi:hypothetical protein
VLPTPGLANVNALRIGQNVRIPPGVQVPPEVRAQLNRSLLVVADGDRVIAIAGDDPVARYRAMSDGARFHVDVPANAVLSGRITSATFLPMFFGAAVPGLRQPTSNEPIDFSLTVVPHGEGAHAELHADAPIIAVSEIRGAMAEVQEAQQQQMREMMEAQQRMQQQQQQMNARPRINPGALPEPPRFQLQPPQ